MQNLISSNNINGDSSWYTLDNAAKIFPAIRSKELTAVFRISVVLKERVKIKHLIHVIPLLEQRFPYYKVTLRKGFFWYYLEQVNAPILLKVQDGIPCREFSKKDKNQPLVRILVFKNIISIEFSHILTDGAGALKFFEFLLQQYFRQQEIPLTKKLVNIPDNDTLSNETEDSYKKYFKENIPPNVKKLKAFHLPYPLRSVPRFDVLIAILPIDEIKKKAKEKGVNITVYLVSIYLYILQDIYQGLHKLSKFRRRKIHRIQVPVNLRNIYPSKTMRNFSLFVMPEIDLRLGYYTFDEILKIVYHTMQLETEEKLINKIISRNVGGEKNYIIRGMPLFLKNMILYLKYYTMGTNLYSGVITNLGKMDFSGEINDKIDYFVITPPPPNRKLKINCGVIGINNKLTLSFGNITTSKEFEKKFLRFIADQGIKVKITKY
jgi:NRPS condensation-like uncharacterized protein